MIDNSLKKILFILQIPPPVHGSSIMGQTIVQSQIINESFNCRYINLLTSTTINEIGEKSIYKLWRYLIIILKVFYYLVKFRPNLCYISITAKGSAFYKDAVVAIIVKLFKIKVIYHFHNKGIKEKQEIWFDNLLYRIVLSNSKIILLSKRLYPDIQKYVQKENVYYCPNGIATICADKNLDIIRKPKDKVEILFLSNLLKSKGVFILLKALQILKNKKYKFHCTFVGGEGDISFVQLSKEFKNLGLDNYVKYVGKKYGHDKEFYFRNSEIFVLPTLNDTFGLVNLEAMQYSLPVISTYEGGIEDIVKNNYTGYLVSPDNVDELVCALEKLIINPELRNKMGREGRIRFKNNFTLAHFEENITRIFNTI